jgi:hypothetical protein
MSLFGRKPRRVPIVPRDQVGLLPAIGRSAYLEGQPTDVSAFYLEGFIAAGTPSTGSPEFEGFLDQFFEELVDAAAANEDEWAFAGAMRIAVDFIGSDGLKNPGFVTIVDSALPFMASVGVSSGYIPMFLLERWNAAQYIRATRGP